MLVGDPFGVWRSFWDQTSKDRANESAPLDFGKGNVALGARSKVGSVVLEERDGRLDFSWMWILQGIGRKKQIQEFSRITSFSRCFDSLGNEQEKT